MLLHVYHSPRCSCSIQDPSPKKQRRTALFTHQTSSYSGSSPCTSLYRSASTDGVRIVLFYGFRLCLKSSATCTVHHLPRHQAWSLNVSFLLESKLHFYPLKHDQLFISSLGLSISCTSSLKFFNLACFCSSHNFNSKKFSKFKINSSDSLNYIGFTYSDEFEPFLECLVVQILES